MVGNAIKFTDAGEISVEVCGSRLNEGTDGSERWRLDFSVKDTGIGIDPDILDTLFDSFSQADSSTTRKYGGTGLGLAICKRLANLMGGEISAESATGEESVFKFSVQADSGSTEAEDDIESSKRDLLQDKRVLVVDDNAVNREILVHQLGSFGMEPLEARSGLEALELLERDKGIDCAVLDMQMPAMDGVELAGRMKSDGSIRETPLVLLSSMDIPLSKRSKELFAGNLIKPVGNTRLRDALYESLAGGPVAKSANRDSSGSEINSELGQKMPLNILLAEDNLVNRKVALHVLNRMGYSVDVAVDGEQAVDMVLEGAYDLVFMDIMMPKLDGLEATRRILDALGGGERLPRIVAVTAGAMKDDRERCIEAGMDDYIIKPFKLDMLTACLAESYRLKRIPS